MQNESSSDAKLEDVQLVGPKHCVLATSYY